MSCSTKSTLGRWPPNPFSASSFPPLDVEREKIDGRTLVQEFFEGHGGDAQERSASRQRERGAAREVLLAVQRGIVEGLPDQSIPGWGEIYFRTLYDGDTAYAEAWRPEQQSSTAIGIRSSSSRPRRLSCWPQRAAAA
jgi:hypothetical protein